MTQETKGWKVKHGKEPKRDMTPSEIILFQIEHVDPEDTAALDEIDFRASLYVFGDRITYTEGNGQTFLDRGLWAVKKPRKNESLFRENEGWVETAEYFVCGEWNQYTRSRDALKAIRPEGWWLLIKHVYPNFTYEGWLYAPLKHPKLVFHAHAVFPTEELAELHAIIQAIQWERNK